MPFKSLFEAGSLRFHPASGAGQESIQRPIPLRTWFSLVVVVYTSLLIAGLEYCLRTFPKATDRRSIPKDSEPESFGPFQTAPLAGGIQLAPSSSLPTEHSLARSYLNSTTPTATISKTPNTASVSWESFKSSEAVLFGNRPGVPGFKAADFAGRFNQSAGLRRRVPPPDQWGSLPDETQLVMFDAYWGEGTESGPGDPDVMYIWAYISYEWDPDSAVMRETREKYPYYCWAVCDGPALVFLDSQCWDNWIYQAGRFTTLLEERPGAVPTQSEETLYGGTACPAVATSSPAAATSSAVFPTEVPQTQADAEPAKPPGFNTVKAPEPTAGAIATSAVSDVLLFGTTIVQTDAQGRPTATITATLTTVRAAEPTTTPALGDVLLITTVIVQTDEQGRPTATITATLTTARGTDPTTTPVVSDLFLITTVVVQTDEQGRPTATVTTTMTATRATFTLGNSFGGVPTATITTALLLEVSSRELTDSRGVPTETLTVTRYLIPTTIFDTATRGGNSKTSLEPYHRPQATLITLATRGTTLTYKDKHGNPTATITSTVINWPDTSRPDPTGPTKVNFNGVDGKAGPPRTHPLSWKEYLLASFTPVLLALPLSILIQMQSSNLKPVLPFYALTKRRRTSREGATAAESLCLVTTGLRGLLTSLRFLFLSGEPLSLLSDLHLLASSLAVSFSSEALGIKLYGHCQAGDFRGCRMGVAVFETPGRVVQAFLSLNLLLGLVMIGFLSLHPDWKRAVDVYARQGCGGLSGTSSMLACQETRAYFLKIAAGLPRDGRQSVSNNDMIRRLDGHSFSLQPFASRQKLTTAAVTPIPGAGSHHYCLVVTPLQDALTSRLKIKNTNKKKKSPLRWRVLSLPPNQQDLLIQLAFFLTITGFLILLLYYELTTRPSPFEHFMSSQSMGVRTLFTCIGLVISLTWDGRFTDAVTKEPYRRVLQAKRQRRGGFGEDYLRPKTGSDSDTTVAPNHSQSQSQWMDHPPIFQAHNVNDTNLGPSSTCTYTSPLSVLFTFTSSQIRNIKRPWMTRRNRVTASELVILTTAIATTLAKITPVLLANVPYSPWLTWRTHQACMWSVVGILVVMILVILHSGTFGLLVLLRRRSLALESGSLNVADGDGAKKRVGENLNLNLNLNLGTLAGRVCLLFLVS